LDLNPAVADVYVASSRQVSLFGKDFGEATVIATAADGSVVYGAKVRVSPNVTSVDQMLKAAMPDSNIQVTTVGQMAVMNGTVASPEDSAQAEALLRSLLNPGVDTSQPGALLKVLPVNRLKTATAAGQPQGPDRGSKSIAVEIGGRQSFLERSDQRLQIWHWPG
jgi:pilus assembly protein CpaC